MITAVVQRWKDGRSSYRPAGEVINSSAFDVAELHDDATPKAARFGVSEETRSRRTP